MSYEPRKSTKINAFDGEKFPTRLTWEEENSPNYMLDREKIDALQKSVRQLSDEMRRKMGIKDVTLGGDEPGLDSEMCYLKSEHKTLIEQRGRDALAYNMLSKERDGLKENVAQLVDALKGFVSVHCVGLIHTGGEPEFVSDIDCLGSSINAKAIRLLAKLNVCKIITDDHKNSVTAEWIKEEKHKNE